MPPRDVGPVLLAVARAAIAGRLGLPAPAAPAHAALAEPGATFVTLKAGGQLRGCIGSLSPLRTLGQDVHENALAAAFRDPRFPPVTAREFADVAIEVSLLSPTERVAVADEADLAARLRPGVDGVILEYAGRRGTFLPQVWESLPEPRAFLAALKRKAGLPEDFWSAQMNVWRYRVAKWTEDEREGSLPR